MVIPDTFGTRGEKMIGSYDFINMIEGTGNITYYIGTGLNASATAENILRSNTFYSNSIITQSGPVGGSSSFVLSWEKNYDSSTLNLPLTCKGTALVSISWAVYGHASATITGYLKAKLIKVSGGSETIIGTGQTGELSKNSTAWVETTTTLKLDLDETHFKKGDILRLSIEGWVKNSTGVFTGKICWGQDPMDRDNTPLIPSTDDIITKTHIDIPFKIEL